MRKPVLYALIAVIVLLIVASAVLFQKYRKSAADYTDMKAAEETARASYAEAFSAIAEIQDSLNAIAVPDTNVALTSQGLQAEQMLTEPHRRQALQRVAVIRASIQRNKEKIRQLEANLRRNGIKIAGLEKMITGLKETVAQKEELVSHLTGRVDSLQTRVTGLEGEVQQSQETIRAREQTIEEKRRELATVYYIVGTKKDLVTSGVIMAKGGFLGLGETLQPSGRFNETLFTPLDTDQENIVLSHAARVQVVSAQPAASYELKLIGGQTELHILDPQEFRKVKHLVILTR
jgi:peptidoglycan hydrolase CwlO-like protein